MSYKIAIPSHERSELCLKTVVNLKKILPKQIEFYVFINENQINYDCLLEHGVFLIKHDCNGIQSTRNYIYNFFEKGSKVVSVDDSFTGLLIKKNNKLETFEDYHNLILIAFNECVQNNTILFGVNIVENPYFMNKKIQFGNYCLSAKFYGFIVDKKTLKSTNPYKLAEDQEVCLNVTNSYNGVIRFGTITFNKPLYGKLEGGVQSFYTKQERKDIEEKSYKYLSKKYPNLCTYKNGGIGLNYKRLK